MANNERDTWDIRGGAAVSDLFARRPRGSFTEPGHSPAGGESLPPIGRGGSNRRTRPDSPPRFAPRHLKMRR
jgi:hypothetical protein